MPPILQTLAELTHFEFECWSDFDFPSLNFAKEDIEIAQDYGEITDEYLERKAEEILSDGTQKDSSTTWALEALNVSIKAKNPWNINDSGILYCQLILPIPRQCPKLKSFTVSTLERNNVTELLGIIQKSCHNVESQTFGSSNQLYLYFGSEPIHFSPDEQESTALILGCPRMKKVNGEKSYA